MKKIIASIKLAPGNRGYFDPLTGINLTISNSIGYIREDDDVSNIRKAIREGKVKIEFQLFEINKEAIPGEKRLEE